MSLGEIAPLQPGGSFIEEYRAVKFVAADLRNDIHDGAASRRFAQPARDIEVHFLGVADIGHIKRDAHPLKAHAQAFYVDLSFVAASAVGLKDAEDRARDAAHIVALNVK